MSDRHTAQGHGGPHERQVRARPLRDPSAVVLSSGFTLAYVLDNHENVMELYLEDLLCGKLEPDLTDLLEGQDLSGANFAGRNLVFLRFMGSDLSGASFAGAYLERAELCSTDLTGASFESAELRGADLRGADLTDAHLLGANLACVRLEEANLSGAKLLDLRELLG